MSKKGKNFSTNNASGKRKKSDFYETPYSITRHLLNKESFDFNKTVCEPARGENAIVKILEEKWNKSNIVSYDLMKDDKDFLKDHNEYDYIITNPPFSIAHNFILHAKKLVKYKFAFLLPLSYLHGKKRYDDIYMDKSFGLKKVYVFTRYPMLGEKLRDDGKYNTGMMVYAWYIFEREYSKLPEIDWIDNNSDVLNKNDRSI